MTGRVYHQTHVHTHRQTWLEAWREALACGAGAQVNAPSCSSDAIPSNSTRGVRWYSLNNKLIARWLDGSMYRWRVWRPSFLFGMILISGWPVAGRSPVPCCSRCGRGPAWVEKKQKGCYSASLLCLVKQKGGKKMSFWLTSFCGLCIMSVATLFCIGCCSCNKSSSREVFSS